MLQSWRCFGPGDPITLSAVRQTGAPGIVTALHHVPIGEPWPEEVFYPKAVSGKVDAAFPLEAARKQRLGAFSVLPPASKTL